MVCAVAKMVVLSCPSVFPSKNHDSKTSVSARLKLVNEIKELHVFSFSSSSYQLSRHKSLNMSPPFVSGVFPGWQNISEIRKRRNFTNSSVLGPVVLTKHLADCFIPNLGQKKNMIRFSRSSDISLVNNHSRRCHA